MEERYSRLIIKAHIDGLLDYSRYQRYDIKWNLKETLTYREVATSLKKEHSALNIECTVAGIAALSSDAKAAVEQHKHLITLKREHLGLIYPWLEVKRVEASVTAEAKAAWQVFEEYQKTEAFKAVREYNTKMLSEPDEESVTNRKLSELFRQKAALKNPPKKRTRF